MRRIFAFSETGQTFKLRRSVAPSFVLPKTTFGMTLKIRCSQDRCKISSASIECWVVAVVVVVVMVVAVSSGEKLGKQCSQKYRDCTRANNNQCIFLERTHSQGRITGALTRNRDILEILQEAHLFFLNNACPPGLPQPAISGSVRYSNNR